MPAAKPTPSSIPEIGSILSTLPDPAYRQDPQIIGIVNDLTNLHTEMAQFNSDLDAVRGRLESEVRDYWNVAEVKRIHFESIEEQLRLAKQEWNDSTKVYQQAEKRMKNEISSREKRIKDIQKRIQKTEGTIGKRVKDLDREKEKQALSL
jgi:predicted  nucleic acid-binding Zn-ribbon protein